MFSGVKHNIPMFDAASSPATAVDHRLPASISAFDIHGSTASPNITCNQSLSDWAST
jgi:hypothetical protein